MRNRLLTDLMKLTLMSSSQGLLEHGKSEREPRPLAPERVAKPAPRRQARDAQLLLEALRGTAADESFEQRQGDESRGAAGWCSTHHADYGQPGPESGSLDLGATPPSPADSARFAQPITFWSDFAVKGSGTTISSSHTGALQRLGTPENQHRSYGYQQNRYSFESGYARVNEPRGVVGHRAGQEHQHHASGAAVSFGKHADFSTPIKEYVKAGVKDL
ncbi:hypothetical protein HKX48_006388 [Thoreauomyces humboldtii]|nr:hypothetical protein HKX48_006388 [Thoreauomyces humboldtii]